MAVFIDTAGKCHRLSGPDMQANADLHVDDPKNSNGLKIEYNGGDTNYNLTLDMQCIGGENNFQNASITSTSGTAIRAFVQSRAACKNG